MAGVGRLVLLNGAPGVGKSTVARRLVEARPLALLLDLDVVRSFLGDAGPDVTASHLAIRERMPQLVGARETWEQMHARLGDLLTTRPRTVRVAAAGPVRETTGAVERVLRDAHAGR